MKVQFEIRSEGNNVPYESTMKVDSLPAGLGFFLIIRPDQGKSTKNPLRLSRLSGSRN